MVYTNAVRLGYLLAISLLLSSLMYFFASNWPALDRWEKIGTSAAVLALFYLFSYLVSFLLKRQPFISNWLLVAGGLSFGICVALLGQIYNSHADSYLLFAVWFVPNLLFAILTRYQPFYVISYVLAHLAIWFYLHPSSINVWREDQWWFVVYWMIALLNLAVYALASLNRLDSLALRVLSLLVFSTALFLASFADVYGPLPELLYMLTSSALFFVFLKWRPSRGALLVTSVYLALFFLYQFFLFLIENDSGGFYLIGLILAAGLVVGAATLIKRMGDTDQVAASRWFRFFREAFTVLVILVGSLIGTSSIMGLMVLISLDDSVLMVMLFFLGVLVFMLPAVFVKQMLPTIRYTLLVIGMLLGMVSSLFQDNWLWMLFLAVLAGVWLVLATLPGRLLTQFFFLLVMGVKLENMFWETEVALTAVFVTQLAMYLIPRFHPVLRGSSLFYGLLSLLLLAEGLSDTAGLLLNIGFFVLSTFLLYWTLHKGRKGEFGISLGFWFAFLLMKYYDFLWSLLHKSLSLLLLSVLFFLASSWLERRNKEQVPAAKPPFMARMVRVLLPVILLQFVIGGYQVWNSETILSQGTLIKLELEPLDPRSLLQGDYVVVSYAISRLDQEDLSAGDDIRVVLRKTAGDAYGFSGYYELDGEWNQPYQEKPGDVVINGRVYGGDRVEYGIESYFVPEGTGRQVETTARYALVRVGKNGDAILERLTAE